MSEKKQRNKRRIEKLLGKPEKNKLDRRFLGKVKDFINEEERAFEKVHLDAYLKGQDKFIYGTEIVEMPLLKMTEERPKVHVVKQKFSIKK